jgi:hypothetical protein
MQAGLKKGCLSLVLWVSIMVPRNPIIMVTGKKIVGKFKGG